MKPKGGVITRILHHFTRAKATKASQALRAPSKAAAKATRAQIHSQLCVELGRHPQAWRGRA